MKRRNLLTKIGSTAVVGTVAVANNVTGKKASNKNSNILSNRSVKELLMEVGDPEIISKSTYSRTVGDIELSAYNFETSAGKLRIIETPQRGLESVFLPSNEKHINHLPERYRDIPNINKSIISITNGEIDLTRKATASERDRLREIYPKMDDDDIAFYNSNVDGFEIIDLETDSHVVIDSDKYGNIMASDFKYIYTTQCSAWACTNCLVNTGGGAGVCGWVCRTSKLTGIKGKVACVGCIIAGAAHVAPSCYKCYNTCS